MSTEEYMEGKDLTLPSEKKNQPESDGEKNCKTPPLQYLREDRQLPHTSYLVEGFESFCQFTGTGLAQPKPTK